MMKFPRKGKKPIAKKAARPGFIHPDMPVDDRRRIFQYQPIVTLGRLALWNALTKNVVDLTEPVIARLKEANPETFAQTVAAELPTTMERA